MIDALKLDDWQRHSLLARFNSLSHVCNYIYIKLYFHMCSNIMVLSTRLWCFFNGDRGYLSAKNLKVLDPVDTCFARSIPENQYATHHLNWSRIQVSPLQFFTKRQFREGSPIRPCTRLQRFPPLMPLNLRYCGILKHR